MVFYLMVDALHEYMQKAANRDAQIFAELRYMAALCRETHECQIALNDCKPEELLLKVTNDYVDRVAELHWRAAGEGALRIPKEVKARYKKIPWKDLRELRDVLTHRVEKILNDPDNAVDRLVNLHVRIQTNVEMVGEIVHAMETESDPNIRGMFSDLLANIKIAAFTGTMVDTAGEGYALIGNKGSEASHKVAHAINVHPKYLPKIFWDGATRSVILDVSGFLMELSVFGESLPDIAAAAPSGLLPIRNELAHFNNYFKLALNDEPIKPMNKKVRRAVVEMDRFEKKLITMQKRNSEQFSPEALALQYSNELVRRLKPEAVEYLNQVVERVQAMRPRNQRLEQCIIAVSSRLLRNNPLGPAKEIIEYTLNHPIPLMHRDEMGQLDAITHYTDAPPSQRTNIRKFTREIQQHCTRVASDLVNWR